MWIFQCYSVNGLIPHILFAMLYPACVDKFNFRWKHPGHEQEPLNMYGRMRRIESSWSVWSSVCSLDTGELITGLSDLDSYQTYYEWCSRGYQGVPYRSAHIWSQGSGPWRDSTARSLKCWAQAVVGLGGMRSANVLTVGGDIWRMGQGNLITCFIYFFFV